MRLLWCCLFMTVMSGGMLAQSRQSDRYFAQGIEAYEKGDYAKAIDWFAKSDALDAKQISPESSRVNYSKAWMGHCHYLLGDKKKARELCPNYPEIKPVDRRITVEIDKEDDLAHDAFNMRNDSAALAHALICKKLEEKTLGRQSIHYVGSMLGLNQIYRHMRDLSTAIKYCDEGLALLDSMGIKTGGLAFSLLYDRVLSYLNQNMTAMTFGDILRLKEIASFEADENEDKYPLASVRFLEGMVELQNGAFSQNDKNPSYQKAVQLAREALTMLMDSYKPERDEVMSTMFDCVVLLDMLGQDELIVKSLTDIRQALDAKNASDDHKGKVLSWLGDYVSDRTQALGYFEQANALLDADSSPGLYFANQCSIANEYALKGEVRKAMDIYNTICEQYRKGIVPQRTYLMALKDLGDLYYSMGYAVEASDKFKEALGLLGHDKSSPDYVMTFIRWIPIFLNSLPYYQNQEEAYNAGFDVGQEFRNIMSTVSIQDLINQGIGVPQLASTILPFYQALVSEATIIPGMQWLDIEQGLRDFIYHQLIPVTSTRNYTVCSALMILGHVNYTLGNYDEAINLSKQAIDIAKEAGWAYDNFVHDLAYYQFESGDTRNAFDNFRTGYEFQKEKILQSYRWMTLEERTAFTNAKRGNLDNIPHYAALAPDDDRYAALGYDALLFTKGLLLNSTIELNRLLQEEGDRESLSLLNEWRELNQKIQSAPDPYNPNVVAMRTKANELEKHLLAKSKTYGDYTQGLTVRHEDVQKCLGEKDIAIEFFSFQMDARSRQYGALVMSKHSGPKYVAIGLDSEWPKYDTPSDYHKDGKIFQMIFRNLIDVMPGREEGNIYFAADGFLHNVALENLPESERYNLRRLSSTRELALGHADSRISNMAMFGGVSYGLGEVADFYKDSKGGTRSSDDFLEYLPGTLTETEMVYDIMSPKCNVSKRTDKSATKNNFLQLSGHHTDILHVATHGFFDNNVPDLSRNADMLSATGLYLAGAQNTLWNMDTKKLKDDGILTAHEISLMDLRGLKLAVLSACETGRGIIGQDGVFGLQRGFKQAGAQSILMSLWKVDDKATQLLMTEFYKNLTLGQSQYDALKQAQTAVKAQYADPEYWAAFILIDANTQISL